MNSADLTDSDGDGLGDACDDTDDTAAKTDFWLEAECATVGSGWRTVRSASASASAYVTFVGERNQTVPTSDVPAQQVTFSTNIERAGTYHFFLRLDAPDAGSNSLWVKVDQGNWVKMWKNLDGTQILTNGFEWRKLNDDSRDVSFNLTTGRHTITVANREPGTRLDKLYLTTKAGGLPTGSGQAASNCGTAFGATVKSTISEAGQPDLATMTEVEVFPNPTLDRLTVDLSSEYTGTVLLRIVDVTGRQVSETAIDKAATYLRSQLNVANLPAGVYRLQLIEGDRQTLRPFIKM